MKIYLSANGPYYVLGKDDISELREKGKLESYNHNEHVKGRISLVDHDPNLLIYRNGAEGLIDSICMNGLRLRRFSGGLHPSDYDGVSLFVLRVQRSFFEEMIKDEKGIYRADGWSGKRAINPRCKYDRFSLVLDF